MLTNYDPNKFIDHVLAHLRLKNDAALSRVLEVAPPLLSRIRHSRAPVGGAILLRMHEATGLSLATLREMMGDRRLKFRISFVHGKPGKGRSNGQAELARHPQR